MIVLQRAGLKVTNSDEGIRRVGLVDIGVGGYKERNASYLTTTQ